MIVRIHRQRQSKFRDGLRNNGYSRLGQPTWTKLICIVADALIWVKHSARAQPLLSRARRAAE